MKEVKESQEMVDMRLSDLETAPWNPRKQFDQKVVNEIADQLRGGGSLLQRPGVWKSDDGHFYVIFGNTRIEACRVAGLKEVPVVLFNCDRVTAMTKTFNENELRSDVYPSAQAVLIGQIFDNGASVDEICASQGLKKSSVYDYLKIAKNVSQGVLDLASDHPSKFSKSTLMQLSTYSKELQDEAVSDWKEDDIDEDWSPSLWQIRQQTRDISHCKFAKGKNSPCATCPKNSANIGVLPGFTDGEDRGSICQDKACFEKLIKDYVEKLIARKTKGAEEIYRFDYAWRIPSEVVAQKKCANNTCAYVSVSGEDVTVKWGPSKKAEREAEKAKKAEEKRAREAAAILREKRDALADKINEYLFGENCLSMNYDEKIDVMCDKVLPLVRSIFCTRGKNSSVIRSLACDLYGTIYSSRTREIGEIADSLKCELDLNEEEIDDVQKMVSMDEE